jgi:hypothetical protein
MTSAGSDGNLLSWTKINDWELHRSDPISVLTFGVALSS